METRTTTEVRIFKLILNPMTANAEAGNIVAISTSYDKLVEFYSSELAEERYKDGRWNKTFKKNSPLEWYNPLTALELNIDSIFGHGIFDEWVREKTWDKIRNSRDFIVIEE